jgi:hypothetical protein
VRSETTSFGAHRLAAVARVCKTRVCVFFFLGASEHVGHLDCVKPLARLGLRMSAKARIRHGNIYHIESG